MPGPPDPKSQRTLTLVAKTLQGLANFSSFGQKEPWMLPMNSFVQDNTAALIDFIEHVSTPAPSTAYRQEWTSPNAAAYVAPTRLRTSLPPLGKEGVPLLPHLIDLPRELGLLATRIARLSTEKGPLAELSSSMSMASGAASDGRCETPSVASSRGGRSRRFIDLVDTCVDVHVESRRRGGGLVSLPPYEDVRLRTPDPKTRTRRMMTGRSAIAEHHSSLAGMRKSLGVPPPLLRTSSSSTSTPNARPSADANELHIRNPAPSTPAPPVATDVIDDFSPVPRLREESETSVHSTASRRTNRAFTINGADLNGLGGFSNGDPSCPPKSFSSEDLSLLASLQASDLEAAAAREAAGSPLPTSQTMRSLASYGAPAERNSLDDEEADTGAPADKGSSTAGYSFPQAKSRVVTRGDPSTSTTSSGRSKSSASSTRSSQIPPMIPTSRIRITQETTTTTTYVSDPVAAAVELRSHRRPVPYEEDTSLAPTSPEEGTPFESSFGTSAFSAPLMRPNPSQTSQHSVLSVLSGRSLASSASTVSISAEVSAGPTGAGAAGAGAGAAGPSAAAQPVVGRRASSAGVSLVGIGRRDMGSLSGPPSAGIGGGGGGGGGGAGGVATLRDDASDGASSGRGSGAGAGGGGKGLLSRAMGRKGSRAS